MPRPHFIRRGFPEGQAFVTYDVGDEEVKTDFLLEKRLRQLDADLHRRFTNSVFALQNVLSGYKTLFPDFTDHTELHSLSVIDFCNGLLGAEQIDRMNADEIYTLLMGCYLHDAGMGITRKDYEVFGEELGLSRYVESHPQTKITDIVREFHHEFSGCFIRKYAALFDFPSPEHLFAVVQVSRGHRRTELFDEKEYPAALRVQSGNTVCLPFLAALIRLADEIDVTAARNPVFLYDVDSMQASLDVWHLQLHRATRDLLITPERLTMIVDTENDELYWTLCEIRNKMQMTLDYCREVMKLRTPYCITQMQVDIMRSGSGKAG